MTGATVLDLGQTRFSQGIPSPIPGKVLPSDSASVLQITISFRVIAEAYQGEKLPPNRFTCLAQNRWVSCAVLFKFTGVYIPAHNGTMHRDGLVMVPCTMAGTPW